MPLRRSSMPKGPDMALFRRLSFGRLFDLHVLDTRQYRSDQSCGDGRKARCAEWANPVRTMMGPQQEKWLADNLRASETRWNVIANQVQLARVVTRPSGTTEDLFAMDNWNGYPVARQRMLDLLASVRQKNPVVVTGDIHTHWVAELKQNVDDPASPTIATEFIGTSITSGGDGNDNPSTVQELNPHIKFFASRRGYVLVTVTPDACTAGYRVVPLVSKPDGPVETRASFIVRSDRAGVEKI
jgi:alkaline phosphatase D